MPIFGIGKKKIDTGTYIGYTQGDGDFQRPTLYFENGHFTQEYDDDKNVGWHPVRGKKIKRESISTEECEYYESIRFDNSKTVEKANFKKAFMNGKIKPSLDEDAKLFECEANNDGTLSAHPSRGMLIYTKDKDFDLDYNEAYARKQMKTAKLAPNESKI